MTHFAIYARYSSDRQSESSIEDQVRLCREYIGDDHLTETYCDYAISGGHIMNRPAFLKLMNDAKDGLFDVVITEALDRLSRDQEDIAAVYKRLKHRGIRIITLAEGEVNELHIGLKGTMNALQLKDLAAKTKRGQRGRVENGAIPGGLTFGYRIVRKFDGRGEPVKGLREIHADEALIIRRIFSDYIKGLSGRRIATALNKEGIPSPRGGVWNASAINGNKARRNGILNNELYIGRIVYNRQTFSKDPETGKRSARTNPEKDWITKYVPELQIVDDDTWKDAQKIKNAYSSVPKHKAKRPKYALSGLLFCSSCNGKLTAIGRDRFGCANAKERGTCTNTTSFNIRLVQEAVLNSLRKHMQQPEKLKEFFTMYHEELHRIKKERAKQQGEMAKRLIQIQKEIDGVIKAILDGLYHSGLKEVMARLEAEKIELQGLLEEDRQIIDIHPNLAALYADKIDHLHDALMVESDASSQSQAIKTLRNLVDKIIVSRDQKNSDIELEIHGNLANIMHLMHESEGKDDCRVSMVAGAGFRHNFPLLNMKNIVIVVNKERVLIQ